MSGRMGIALNASLYSIYQRDHWNLPPARSEEQVQLHAYLSTVQLEETEDKYEWIVEGKLWTKYSTGGLYKLLKPQLSNVPWFKTVWCSRGIPKHNFLTWLFTLDRCPTKSRIIEWGLNTNPLCMLCNSQLEDRNHLLFECSFSWLIWEQVSRRCSIQPLRSWDLTISAMTSLRCSKPKKILCLLAWQCSIYLLWAERNARLHRQQFRSASSIFSTIDSTLRNRCSTLRESNSALASSMLQLWFSTSSTSSARI